MHSHAAAVPVVLAIGVAVLALPTTGRRLWDVGGLAAGVLATTALVSAVAFLRWGTGDIFSPTIDQYLRLRRPDQIALWHSEGWAWADRATYLLVPAMLLLALVAAWSVRRDGSSRTGGLIVIAGGVSLAAAAVLQATGGFTLEYYFYSSLLWWFVPFVVALLAEVLVGDRSELVWVVSASLVVFAGIVVLAGGPPARFGVAPVGLLLAVVGVVIGGASALRSHSRVAALGLVALIVVAGVLTIGQPVRSYAPGQVSFPLVDYSALARSNTERARDVYRVATQLPAVVPPPRAEGDKVITWATPSPRDAPGPPLNVVRQAAAQYLASRLSSAMPRLEPSDVAQLDKAPSGTVLLLLGTEAREFNAAVRSLEPWRPMVLGDEVLSSDGVVLHVRLVRLG